ncbi:MAG: YdiU family protein [Deltaproteobacteria bacterium]|nr:MAG: YdiU family protein [Deltaproteobacteria bacterium]
MDPTFDNRYLRALPGAESPGPGSQQLQGVAWARVAPTPVAAPRLLAFSPEVADQLGLTVAEITSAPWIEALAGNRLLPGMEPWADGYGGHQFGHWAGQLGDGRALSLGQLQTPGGGLLQLQLKGAGPTPYSRRADGRAVLRSSIREFLCSEAMHHLGIPTTRALSLVATGDLVLRDMFYDGHAAYEPGAIVCRVAPSFLRFGTFELPASRGEDGLLAQLLDYLISEHFPEIARLPTPNERRIAWFVEICERTARLVAHWMRVGFVHGVMNTDNLSALGLTIDYGPYGWLDHFDPDFTPNTTDAERRRYRFRAQPDVALWNLGCLGGAVSRLLPDAAPLREALDRYTEVFAREHSEHTASKLGLDPSSFQGEPEEIAVELFTLMRRAELDFTLTFRALMALDPRAPDPSIFDVCAYDPNTLRAEQPALVRWLARYAGRARREDPEARLARMRAANPKYILRNYLVQQVIDRAEAGDPSGIEDLLDLARRPYDDQPEREHLAARRPEWARHAPGCSMLSCSS